MIYSCAFVVLILHALIRAGPRMSTKTRMVATTGTRLAPTSTGPNEYRSLIFPIRSVEMMVPIPAAAPLIPLTVATALLGYRSAGKDKPIVDQGAEENIEKAKRAMMTAKC